MTDLEKQLLRALEEMLDIVRLQTSQYVKDIYADEIAGAELLASEARRGN